MISKMSTLPPHTEKILQMPVVIRENKQQTIFLLIYFLNFWPDGHTLFKIWTFPRVTKLQLPGRGLHTSALGY